MRLARFLLTSTLALLVGAAVAQPSLKMMIPANPGGGWDQTGRNLAAAMQSAKLVSGVQFDNKGGAAGTIGLAQFVNSHKGDPGTVMIGGQAMVAAVELNRSAPWGYIAISAVRARALSAKPFTPKPEMDATENAGA